MHLDEPNSFTCTPHFEHDDNNNQNNLKCISLNARSVSNKINEIRTIIEHDKPDVFCITETHLCPEIISSEIFPQNFKVIRKDRNRHGGGILIAYQDSLSIIHREDLETNCEIIWCEVLFKNTKSTSS